MTEQQYQSSDQGAEIAASNVVPFNPGARLKHEPPHTDEELAEYRRIRPMLLQIIEQFPQLLQEHRVITSNCMLARKILSGDP